MILQTALGDVTHGVWQRGGAADHSATHLMPLHSTLSHQCCASGIVEALLATTCPSNSGACCHCTGLPNGAANGEPGGADVHRKPPSRGSPTTMSATSSELPAAEDRPAIRSAGLVL